MKIHKTPQNPYGLTYKQDLVIKDIAKRVYQGEPIDPASSTKKFYKVSSEKSAKDIAYLNMKRPNFREGLIAELEKFGVFGENSKISLKLDEGLDATNDKGNVDYDTRLKYIQEINKITGVYAPLQSEKKSMNLNVDVSDMELNEKIKQLQEELAH